MSTTQIKQKFPFLTALEHSHVPSAVLTSDGVVTWMNPAARLLIGDVRGQKWDQTGVVPPEEFVAAKKRWQAMVEGGVGNTIKYETVLKAVDGEKVPICASATLMNAGGIHVVFRQFYPKAPETELAKEIKHKLTDRQLEILKRIALGEQTETIAAELDMGKSTVKAHVRRILGIMRVKSRAAAVALAYQEGIL